MRALRRLLAAVAGLGLALSLSAASASTTVDQTFSAAVTGTVMTTPANGILTIYDDPLNKHHTRDIVYTQHDGYFKTENLVSAANPFGIVLIKEYIENACKSDPDDGSVNPVGGYNIACGGHLVTTDPGTFPLGGDLTGRFCRIAMLPDTSPADCTSDPIHVDENAGGSGRYLQVGNKDHGAMLSIEYYANVAGTNYDVTVNLPIGTSQLPHGAEVTEVILLPQGTSQPHAVLALQ